MKYTDEQIIAAALKLVGAREAVAIYICRNLNSDTERISVTFAEQTVYLPVDFEFAEVAEVKRDGCTVCWHTNQLAWNSVEGSVCGHACCICKNPFHTIAGRISPPMTCGTEDAV